MQDWTKQVREHKTLAAALFFLILALIFLNRTLIPPQGELLGGHDLRGYYHPFLSAVRDGLRSGELPFWTPYLFNGLPLLSDPQIGAFYPPAWPATFSHLDATVVLSRALASQGFFPAVEPLESSSRSLGGSEKNDLLSPLPSAVCWPAGSGLAIRSSTPWSPGFPGCCWH